MDKHGSYAYENWFDKCGWSKEASQLSHDSAFYRAEIKRKYGLYVSINTPTANPNVATNASGEGMVNIKGPDGTTNPFPAAIANKMLNDSRFTRA